MKYIVGIDASWTACGLALVSEDEQPCWLSAVCKTIKTTKKKYKNDSERLAYIVDQLVEFCVGSRIAGNFEIDGVYIEDFYGGMAVKPLGRLRGAIDHEVWRRLHMQVQPVNCTQARKLLLGPMKKTDRKQIKKIVLNRWQVAGAPVVDDAQADALTIANYALHLRGKPCLRK